MSHPDTAPVLHRGPGGFSSPPNSHDHHSHHYNHHHSRYHQQPRHHRYPNPPPFARDAAMKRDRSRDARDRSRDRRRPEHDRRVSAFDSHSRLPPPSPAARPPPGHRGRDQPYDGNGGSRSDAPTRRRSHDRGRDNLEGRRDYRGRDEHLAPDRRRDLILSPHHHSRPRDRPGHFDRERSLSPSSRKRRRTRSPLPPPSLPSKKSRRERERERDRRRKGERSERPEGDPSSSTSFPSWFERPQSPSHRRSLSPVYDDRRSRYSDRSEPLDPPRHHRRTRSPLPPREADFERGAPPSRPHRDSRIRDRSRSPHASSRRSSFSRTHSPPRSFSRLGPGSLEAGSHTRRSPSPSHLSRGDHSPSSPREHGARRSRKKAKSREERFSGGGPAVSGANSIEVGMSRRGESRGGFGGQMAPGHRSRPRYNDHRRARSPSHANSGSSYHGSPASQSPFGSGRAGRMSQRQFSPSNQPPPHHHGQHAHSAGRPSSRRASSQSPPPPPPTGPSRGRGFSRGSFRGGLGATRGGRDDNVASRGAASWSGRPGSSRDHSSFSDNDTSRQPSPRHIKDIPMEDPPSENPPGERMPPPRPPPSAPTGPASSKFSFAFKAASKAPVAAPKPEISQKFSAAPKKEAAPAAPADDRDRELPRDTPRGPASSRPREDYHHNRHPPEPQHTRHPPEPPRTRKVKKIRRRLLPKPKLDPELAKSDSVYFRKPGNESVIGSGTYGKVFKGRHVYTNKLVALKKIRMEGERDGFPVTAVREIKLLQSLKHTNIVQLREVMVEKNDCYMVFEYLSHDLTGLLNHPSYQLDPAQKKHLAKQLFEGLDYLHKRGVLHRDIKAANILVSNDGILKLADFGLARFYAKRHQIDYTNRVITIWYRSPELLLGETQYGAAVDIWSAACVMVEIFTRHAIFPGDGGEINQLEKIYNVLGTPNRTDWPGLVDMPWFELLRPGYRKPNVFAEKYKEWVPAAAFELLSEMFQYDPVKRPSAADALEHPYFTTEYPPPRQAVELKDVKGDWHEFESKALRREKEKQVKQEREAKRAAAAKEASQRDRDKKRAPTSHEAQRDPKRPHVEGQAPTLDQASEFATTKASGDVAMSQAGGA
ncbi:Pkinase-domain-containing protein [Xylariaceae sp. FL0804]|nr:Pkinase-domain-containing protein [Xylariaceae sp. FL0804]